MKILPIYRSSLERSEVHEILRNNRRRETIKFLREKVGAVSLRKLSEVIAEREAGESPAPRDHRESVYNSLHQTHLPKLNEWKVISYDLDHKTVQLDKGAREVYVQMEVINRYGITWADYYRSLGVLALMTIVAADLGVPLLTLPEPVVISAFFLAIFTISTARQLWVNRWLYLRVLLSGEQRYRTTDGT